MAILLRRKSLVDIMAAYRKVKKHVRTCAAGGEVKLRNYLVTTNSKQEFAGRHYFNPEKLRQGSLRSSAGRLGKSVIRLRSKVLSFIAALEK